MDGLERVRLYGKGVGWTGGLVLRLLTALNGRPRAMTSGGCGEEGGCEGLQRGTINFTQDGPKWTA